MTTTLMPVFPYLDKEPANARVVPSAPGSFAAPTLMLTIERGQLTMMIWMRTANARALAAELSAAADMADALAPVATAETVAGGAV